MPPKIHKNIKPLKPDPRVTFNSIGGLEEHIKCLREIVLFPLLYPNLFERFNTHPPKGVLFHGPPGTGKTLLARALANECTMVRGQKVAFFMRKGADIMSKWYGESEKDIKMLFKQAKKLRPSIIFFDEIDALAPTRSKSVGEVHVSVVATLLVEMDGLRDRGAVIVIGATNRPDCLDPALRRTGRFDRELYFPPPSVLARRDILAINTRYWLPRPTEEEVDHIAQMTNGYLGSDLNALCSEAVLKALRRVCPQVYTRDYSCISYVDTRIVKVTVEDLVSAMRSVLPAGARFSPLAARDLPAVCEPLLRGQVLAAAALLKQAFPSADPSQSEDVSPGVLLVSGECTHTHLAPALLAQLEDCAVRELSMATLHSHYSYSEERAILSIFSESRRSDRSSVIFVPDIGTVWAALSSSGAALLLQLWQTRAAGDNVLLLATCSEHYNQLSNEIQELFPVYKNCVYTVRPPTPAEVVDFLMPIISELPTSSAHEKCDLLVTDTVASSGTATSVARKRRHMDINSKGSGFKRARYAKETSLVLMEDDNSYELKEEANESCTDLGKVLRTNADSLCSIGLAALTDLHSQLNNACNVCIKTRERWRLPHELYNITLRYLKFAKK